jgi:uncharacterized protein (DUF58 family)
MAAGVREFFFFFVLVLLILGALMGEDYIFVLLYLLAGSFILARFWGRSAIKGLRLQRDFNRRAFLGEQIQVRLMLRNQSLLPVPWVHLREALPVELKASGAYQQIATIGPKGENQFEFTLDCRKRGYYPIGPLDLFTNDILGMTPLQRSTQPAEYLTVYPKIVSLKKVKLPSHSPLGTLRHTQPIFEDPSRVRGKRDYVSGDSLRRVDWKASAASGRLQVRLFEPSIALETAIFLNLNASEFDLRQRYSASELAIVVAASLANWITSVRQSVGLVTNGIDPLLESQSPTPLLPNRGRGQLLRILEILARIQLGESISLAQMIRRQTASLAWGSTLLIVTSKIDDELFDSLFHARRSGLDSFLVQCGPMADFDLIRRRASYFGFPIQQIFDERDLEIWRR